MYLEDSPKQQRERRSLDDEKIMISVQPNRSAPDVPQLQGLYKRTQLVLFRDS